MAHTDQTADGLVLNPYHRVVRGKVLHGFDQLNQRDPSAVLALMNDDVHYTFEGDHALGGTRVTRVGVEKWFGRLLRLLESTFAIKAITVVGWPWATQVFVTFEDAVKTAAGDAYVNHGFQVIDLKWGGVTGIHTYVDTAKLSGALIRLGAAGNAEAVAAPILE